MLNALQVEFARRGDATELMAIQKRRKKLGRRKHFLRKRLKEEVGGGGTS